MSSVITMSAPFFLGRIIDVIYTNPTVDYGYTLTRLCLALSGVFLCGAAANTVRVYLMQTSGKRALILPSEAFQRIRTGAHVGFRALRAPCSSFPTVPSSGDEAPCLARRGSYEYFSICAHFSAPLVRGWKGGKPPVLREVRGRGPWTGGWSSEPSPGSCGNLACSVFVFPLQWALGRWCFTAFL